MPADHHIPRIHPSWRAALDAEFSADYVRDLRTFLRGEQERGIRTWPPNAAIFGAFDSTPFEAVRVVIVGQDPYHGPGQAMGLAFSVPRGVPIPPSLRNIYRELHDELGVPPPDHGDLSAWAERGVLLLNSTLTVQSGSAASHRGRGWERFTDAAIRALADQRDGLVFLLWGRSARDKGAFLDRSRHLVLEAAHPSPLSASNGFFGCGHFAQTDAWLRERGEPAIDWSLPR